MRDPVLSRIAHRSATGEPLPDPGAELTDDGVFVCLAAQSEELAQVARIEARKGLARWTGGIAAVAAEKVTDHNLILQSPDLGDAQSGVDRHAVERAARDINF